MTAARHLNDCAPPDVDITILEVMMPGMNGLDVLREMRTFSDIPVLMLTARGEDIDRFVGLETVRAAWRHFATRKSIAQQQFSNSRAAND